MASPLGECTLSNPQIGAILAREKGAVLEQVEEMMGSRKLPSRKPKKILHYINPRAPSTHSPLSALRPHGLCAVSHYLETWTLQRETRGGWLSPEPHFPVLWTPGSIFVSSAPSMQVAERGTPSRNGADRL